MMLRLLGWQGIAGLVAALALATLLIAQKIETRHWRKQSVQYERLYRAEQSAFAATVANHRAAADAARAADRANAERVAAEQRAINERTEHDFETRLAAARAAADRLREPAAAATGRSPRGTAPVPGLSTAAGGPAQGADQDRLPVAASDLDWRLTATEQAIQLEELVKWVRRQAGVSTNGPDKP